jgi:murein DD-endopeptidase MepM/ murein hydrolase activator NlpD
MVSIHKAKKLIRKAFTPVTIMLVPHNSKRPFNLKIPSIGIVLSVILWLIGTVVVFSKAVETFEYRSMKRKLTYYSEQLSDMKGTIMSLRSSQMEFQRLFSFKSKKEVIENLDASPSGSLDIEALRKQIATTVETVSEIKEYLQKQRDVYRATPSGFPVEGRINSYYGYRIHPVTGEKRFHSGVDIAAESGTPIRAAADGIVSFSGWSGDSGNLVVLEHGLGFATYYAHNKRNGVTVGQKVKKGEVLGYVGSTGNAQCAHLHYSVSKDGQQTDPRKYLEGGPYVQQK